MDHLNSQQQRAVTSQRKQVMILAGPGSGKTRIIVHRVAHLLETHQIDPRRIMVATFTNKAARELKERLGKLVNPDISNRLLLGTYHKIMMTLLRRHGHLINLQKFGVIDQEDALAIVRELVNEEDRAPPEYNALKTKKQITDNVAKFISKAKSRNIPSESFTQHFTIQETALDCNFIRKIYSEYQQNLRSNRLLDFDDILVFGLKLLQQHPYLVARIQHVLIDEFQDTNTIQYLIMAKIIEKTQYVTVVGDPDQSIYGWRSADITNLKRFRENYSDIDMVFLEQNYRSTQSILRASLSVISQDQERIVKGLWTENDEGAAVVLKACQTMMNQAQFVVNEIQRLKNHSRGMLEWRDFVIVYRIGRYASTFEKPLRLARIPYNIIGGIKFFDRKEIKDILAYLRLADNPNDMTAFKRVINVPPRKIGKVAQTEILESAERLHLGVFEVCERIARGTRGLSRAAASHLKPFVNILKQVQRMANENYWMGEIIQYLLKELDYEAYLRRTYKSESAERMEHLADFLDYANTVEKGLESPGGSDALIEVDDEETNTVQESGESILSRFLADIALQTNDDGLSRTSEKKNHVTLMTLHASKGLEFPVVFIVGVQDGVLPHNMTDDLAEERRLLYVGMTRAKALLYITHAQEHPYGFLVQCDWSSFVKLLMRSAIIKNAMQPNLIVDSSSISTYVESRKTIEAEDWSVIAKVLGREYDPDGPLGDDPDDQPVPMTPVKWTMGIPYGSPGSGYAGYGSVGSSQTRIAIPQSSTPSPTNRIGESFTSPREPITPSKSSSALLLQRWAHSGRKKPETQSSLSQSSISPVDGESETCHGDDTDNEEAPDDSKQSSASTGAKRSFPF